MKYRVQVWLHPSIGLGREGTPGELVVPSEPHEIRVRPVVVDITSRGATPMLLLETDSGIDRFEADFYSDFRRVGGLITRLSFCLLAPFAVVSARVIELADGKPTKRSVVFPGAPPGIAVFEGRIGFTQHYGLIPEVLSGDLTPNAEIAMTWFLAGLHSANAQHQAIAFWIGLEALTTYIQTPMKCPRCDATFETCSNCGQSTFSPAVTRSVITYLQESFSVSKKEASQLYELRCKLSHGNVGMDPEGLKLVSEKTGRLEELLLLGIKKCIGLGSDKLPIIEMEGSTIVGVPGMVVEAIEEPGTDFLDRPGILGIF